MKRKLSTVLLSMALSAVMAFSAFAADTPRLQDDYYDSVNAEWLELAVIPEDKNTVSPFSSLNDDNIDKIVGVMAELAASGEDYPEGSAEQIAADTYLTAVDWETRNRVGYGETIEGIMKKIENAKTVDEYVDVISREYNKYSFNLLFGFSITSDTVNPSKFVRYLDVSLTNDEGALASDDETYDDIKMAYKDFMKELFESYGFTAAEAAERASLAYELLVGISENALSGQELYDPDLYFRFKASSLNCLMSNIDMENVKKIYGLDNDEIILANQADAINYINSMLTEENLDTLKAFAQFKLLLKASSCTTYENLVKYSKFHAATSGSDKPQDAESINLDILVSKVIPFTGGDIFAEYFFTPEAKAEVEQIVEEVKQGYRELITASDWMSEPTKAHAIEKLNNMLVEVAYPSVDYGFYDGANVLSPEEGGSLIDNYLSVQEAYNLYTIDLFERNDADIAEGMWAYFPSNTVNAFNFPNYNAILMPAGILADPFYSTENTHAQNLGGIGSVIAHEISHGFDNNGAKYDIDGSVSNWWTDADYAEFNRRVDKFIEYYNGYELTDGYNVDGANTVSENVADMAAMECITYILKDDPEALKEAYSQYAESSVSKCSDSYLLNVLLFDTHSPDKVRVNAVLSSIDEFYEVYGIKEGDGMYVPKEERLNIWS